MYIKYRGMSGVTIWDTFISHEECQYLINTYDKCVVPSVVVGQQVHPSRTSSTYYLPNTDPIVKKIKEKVAEKLKVEEFMIEPIQFLRYTKGQRYLYHYDYLPGDVPNQRVHTVLVYLNTLIPEQGGATSFFHYKQKVYPKEGQAVWFRNMNEDGTLNKDSLHAGEEIVNETAIKYALNIWTRQSRY
jgi:prolyl 4-hydroxylase